MNFSAAMAKDIAGVRHELAAIRGLASEMGHDHPALLIKCTAIMQRGIALAAHVNSIEVIASAGRMLGAVEHEEPQKPVGDLPLFAGVERSPLELLASLHRAGDHTLDPEES